MKYIIMCGGTYPEWTTPRWLVPVKGEPNVVRTIRMLREQNIDDIAISTNTDAFNELGVEIIKYDKGYICGTESYWVDGFPPTDDPVCYIFGDVVYSHKAIQIIKDFSVEDTMFFGSMHPFGQGYTKPWAEPFGFKVENTTEFQKAVEVTKTYQDQGRFNRIPIAWELWQVIRNTPLNQILNNYCPINDYTCDIDYPEDAAKIAANIPDIE